MRGTRDAGKAGVGRPLHSRRVFEGLERNRRGERAWPLVDSFGDTLCRLRVDDGAWRVTDPEGADVLGEDDEPRLELQGRGAMVDDLLETAHALVAVKAGLRVRAFIDRRALPERNARGQAIRAAVDDYDTGHGSSRLPTPGARPLADPGFEAGERFLGTDDVGRTYSTYNAKPHLGGAIYFMVNTTGVFGGGIVRGVARAGVPFHEVDRMADPDPNVPAGEPPLCRWVFGRIADSRMWGWVAEREPAPFRITRPGRIG